MKIYNIINIPKGLSPENECDCQGEYNSGYTAGLNACSGGTGNEDLIANLQGDYFLIPEGTTKLRNGAFSLGNPRKDDAYPTQAFVIPDSVTEIGDGAFHNNTIFSSLTIPDTVKSIGQYAFFGMSSLREIHLPSGITTIPTDAFDYAFSSSAETLPPVQPVVIPASVTEIGRYAFDNCYELKEIIFEGSGITAIPEIAFGGCYTLTGFTMPEGVTSIGRGAFSGCRSLSAITIPSGVTEIGNNAFQGCRTLTGISLPDGITTISAQTFDGCSAMTTVKLPSGLTSIQNAGFSNCVALTSITIPAGVTQLGTRAFLGCSALTEMVFEGTTPPNGDYNTSLSSLGSSAYTFPFIVPCESVDAYKTKFGTRYRDRVTCNSGQTMITGLTLNVDSAITGSGQASVTVEPSGGEGNLSYSSSDNTVATIDSAGTITVLSSGTVNICVYDSRSGLQDCETITATVAPQPSSSYTLELVYETTTQDENIVFYDLDSFISGQPNPGLYANEKQYAESWLNDIESIEIDGTATTLVSAYTFSTPGKHYLKITTPNVILPSYMFSYERGGASNDKLVEAHIGEGMRGMRYCTFRGDTNLTAITIPESLVAIGWETFKGTGILEAEIPDSVTAGTLLTDYRPYRDEYISPSIDIAWFSGCTSLTSATIGSGLSIIQVDCFAGCSSLLSITIPDNITIVSGGAFNNCTSLTAMTFTSTTPPTLGTNALGSTSYAFPIYVPASAVETYKTAWPDYASRIQAITD